MFCPIFQKTFDSIGLEYENKVTLAALSVEKEGGVQEGVQGSAGLWTIADSFKYSGYAHKKHLTLIKLRPLAFGRKRKKKRG